MKKNRNLIIGLIILSAVGITTVLPASCALATGVDIANSMISSLENFALPGGGDDPNTTIETVIGRTIQTFLSVMGIIFLALMLFGGYKWMIAQGREEEVTKAKNIIKSAVIGLGIVLIAYAITYFVVYMFTQASLTA